MKANFSDCVQHWSNVIFHASAFIFSFSRCSKRSNFEFCVTCQFFISCLRGIRNLPINQYTNNVDHTVWPRLCPSEPVATAKTTSIYLQRARPRPQSASCASSAAAGHNAARLHVRSRRAELICRRITLQVEVVSNVALYPWRSIMLCLSPFIIGMHVWFIL